jgi:Polyketide cyclase / dehydrase and lipid transport
MQLLASSVATIACSSTTAFDYAADLQNFSDWFPGVVGIAAGNEMPFTTPGKQYVETVAVPLRATRTVRIEVVEAEPAKRLVTEGDMPLLLPRMEIEFDDVGDHSCQVRWRMLSRNENVVARIAVFPLARWLMGRRAAAGLRNLKERLEGPPR